MTDEQRSQLVSAACAVRRNAHAPYSGFTVGAALLTSEGRVISGCNIENASYGLTVCAERTVVFRAVAEGSREFRSIAIASSGGAAPCGACRQVLAEFCDDLEILLVDANAPDRIRETSLSALLPDRFGRHSVGERPA
jgi:cytidine deaminase